MNQSVTSFLKVLGAIVIPGGFLLGGIYVGSLIRDFKNIDYKFFAFKIKSAGAGFIDLTISLEIINPSNANIDILGYSFDATVNGINAAAIKNTTPKTLTKKSSSVLEIPITIKYLELINKTDWNKIVEYFLTGKTDKIFVTLNGYISGKVAKIPITKKIGVSASVKDLVQKNSPQITIK
jgi:LEA14-like dessication related protein